MKKPSKQTRSNLLNAILILGTIAIVVYLGARNGDIGASMDAILRADWRWLLFALLAWALNIVFESVVMHLFFRQQKVDILFPSIIHNMMIGQFYSAVTPAATGGQPMQVFSFKKRGVPTGVSSSGLAVKFFCYQTAVLVLGGVLWLVNAEYVNQCIADGKWFVWLGFLINGLTVGAVLLLAINRNIVRALIVFSLKIGHALHLVKDMARASSRADAALEDFRSSVYMITHHPMHVLVLLAVSFAQVAALMSVAYCVYRALGLSGAGYEKIMTLQLLLYIGAAFSPLPGASGAQEGGFFLFFKNVIPGEYLLAALLLWRFFTYYIAMLTGLCAVISESVISMRKNSMHMKDVIREKKLRRARENAPPDAQPQDEQTEQARTDDPAPQTEDEEE